MARSRRVLATVCTGTLTPSRRCPSTPNANALGSLDPSNIIGSLMGDGRWEGFFVRRVHQTLLAVAAGLANPLTPGLPEVEAVAAAAWRCRPCSTATPARSAPRSTARSSTPTARRPGA